MAIPATEEELEELRRIRNSAVQSVESDGRKVVYDLSHAERTIQKANASGKSRRRHFAFSRGY